MQSMLRTRGVHHRPGVLPARAALVFLIGLALAGCVRDPPVAPEAPCACDASRGGAPHRASGRTEIIR